MRSLVLIYALPISSDDTDSLAADASEFYRHADPIFLSLPVNGEVRAMLFVRIWRMRKSMSLESITKQIREEVAKLNQVLRLLEGTGVKQAKATKHTMSAAGRRKISLAQKKRWAKARAGNVVSIASKRGKGISAAGRKRIAAAQRVRWAKVRAAKKK
jgi:hypothetical protein